MGICPDIYVWITFLADSRTAIKWLYWLPSILLVVSILWINIVSYSRRLLRIFFFLVLCTGFPKIFFALFSSIGHITGFSAIGDITGIIIAIISILCFAYGLIFGWRHVIVKHFTISSSCIPKEFNGYKIAQLSDIHAGSFALSTETLRKMSRLTNKQHPDIILFTGDLVNASPNELDPFEQILSSLHAPDGILSVLGNHDYCFYTHYHGKGNPKKSLKELIKRENRFGWDVLRNENHIIKRGESQIAIIGVENDGKPPFPSYSDLPKAIKGTENCLFRILMSHDPSHWRREILPESDIQLTLSGHTHAAQLKIGHLTPARLAYREWGGLYAQNGRFLYVSDGIGGTFPFRFGAWPAVDIITLEKN